MAQIISRFKDVGVERVGNGVLTSGQTLDKGMLVMAVAAGTVQQLNNTAGAVFAGIAKHAAGDTNEPEAVELDYGTPFFFPKATAAQADVGAMVYGSALGEVDTSGSNGVIVGRIVDVEVGVGWFVDPMFSGADVAYIAAAIASKLTYVSNGVETTDASGEIAVTGMTATGSVQVTPAEDLGTNLVLADVVCGTDKITVYTRNTNTDARAALNAKDVHLLVIALS